MPRPRPCRLLHACLVPFVLLPTALAAQESWIHRPLQVEDRGDRGRVGTNVDRVYADWPLREDAEPIVVAVIDSGMDIDHEDLRAVLWHNPGEVGGEVGVDDDDNGYVDDLHGWNFIGRADGSAQLTGATRIVTRELRRLRALAAERELTAAEQEHLAEVEERYAEGLASAQRAWARTAMQGDFIAASLARMAELGADPDSLASIRALDPEDPFDRARQATLLRVLPKRDRLDAAIAKAGVPLERWYSLGFDDSSLIGDDPADLAERHYGNALVSVAATDHHGTHVAGIIAADRTNDTGIDGICAGARIMVLRAVPDGDERDKDIANAIRYAADNGARVINMSFGKPWSPHKNAVDAAARYALERDVLLIGAAGNDGLDIDERPHFPMPSLLAPLPGEAPVLPHWLLVGACGGSIGERLPAPFSNYGDESVHLFAPGVEIPSTVPGGGYGKASGTSMAAPVVAGIAALIRWQFPDLDAVQVAEILRDSSHALPDLRVRRPGGKDRVRFGALSTSAGLVDAWAAMQAAAELSRSGPQAPTGAADAAAP